MILVLGMEPRPLCCPPGRGPQHRFLQSLPNESKDSSNLTLLFLRETCGAKAGLAR